MSKNTWIPLTIVGIFVLLVLFLFGWFPLRVFLAPPVLLVSSSQNSLTVTVAVNLLKADQTDLVSIDYRGHPILDIQFGDGTDQTITGLDPIYGSTQISHTYNQPGTYSISIVETFAENNMPNPVRDLASTTVNVK